LGQDRWCSVDRRQDPSVDASVHRCSALDTTLDPALHETLDAAVDASVHRRSALNSTLNRDEIDHEQPAVHELDEP
jgi:hypothetical protein